VNTKQSQIVAAVVFENGISMEVRPVTRCEGGLGVEEGCGEVVEAGDVVGKNLRGGDPVIEGEVECDGFLNPPPQSCGEGSRAIILG
jgi:hypothetical protein